LSQVVCYAIILFSGRRIKGRKSWLIKLCQWPRKQVSIVGGVNKTKGW